MCPTMVANRDQQQQHTYTYSCCLSYHLSIMQLFVLSSVHLSSSLCIFAGQCQCTMLVFPVYLNRQAMPLSLSHKPYITGYNSLLLTKTHLHVPGEMSFHLIIIQRIEKGLLPKDIFGYKFYIFFYKNEEVVDTF